MALQKEIWIKDIQENLFANSDWLTRSQNLSAFISNKTVHIPQAGSAAGVTKNRSSLPATIAQRTDSDYSFNLNEYSSDPFVLTNIDELQVSYDKRNSILKQYTSSLEEVIGNQTLYAWSPSATTVGVTRYVRTTGSLSTGALSSGATGSRSAVTIADIARVKAILDNDNVPQTGRVLIMPSDMYNSQLLAIQDVYQMQSYGSAVLPDGAINRIMGFDIYIRPTVVSYVTGSTPAIATVDGSGKVSTTTISDNLAAIAFHPDYVGNALGDTKIFFGEDKPEYYGDLFSALVMHGASRMRVDGKGVAAIIQQGTMG